MKVLIIQLGRLGDLIQTSQAIKSYKASYPNVSIDVLVRERFKQACYLLENVNTIYQLESKKILAPIVKRKGVEKSLLMIKNTLQNMIDNNYDLVFDLTYSPLSSYICRALEEKSTHVNIRGYSRYNDGSFCAKGEESYYVFSQVGIERFNKVHLNKIFCSQLQVEEPKIFKTKKNKIKKIGVHIGGSQLYKQIPNRVIVSVLKNIIETTDNEVYLFGDGNDVIKANRIVSHFDNNRIINKVGRTNFKQLCDDIENLDFILSPDSMITHLASYFSTPCLCVFREGINFWETGPWYHESIIVCFNKEIDLIEDLKKCINYFMTGIQKPIQNNLYFYNEKNYYSYYTNHLTEDDYSWQLIKSLYFGEDFPISKSNQIVEGLRIIFESVSLYKEQLNSKNISNHLKIINTIEECIYSVETLSPKLSPLVNYYKEQMIKIGPGELNQVIIQMNQVLDDIHSILKWLLFKEIQTNELEEQSINGSMLK